MKPGAQLQEILDSTYDLDYSVRVDTGQVERKKMRVFDAGLAQYVLDRFVPRRGGLPRDVPEIASRTLGAGQSDALKSLRVPIPVT